jgi:hypothetical protein
MIAALSTLINANTNIDKMLKKQCQYIINGTDPMMSNTYLLGIVEGISYAIPYSDSTDLAKSTATENVMKMACKNALENRTLHGFDADYKWQVIKLTSKKHKTMKQQF